MFEELFRRKRFNAPKALAFGFVKKGKEHQYTTDIMDGTFRLKVVILPDQSVRTDLTEAETGEEYVLYKTNAAGAFVGEVRTAVETILRQVAEHCFDTEIFKWPQTKEIIAYVTETYGDDLEFLWQKFPDNAVWRRKDTAKWYGAILTVARNKLGQPSKEVAEIIDLRIPSEDLPALLEKDHYYPGWHMNKKHWFTVILDGTVPTETICRHIDESYRLAR